LDETKHDHLQAFECPEYRGVTFVRIGEFSSPSCLKKYNFLSVIHSLWSPKIDFLLSFRTPATVLMLPVIRIGDYDSKESGMKFTGSLIYRRSVDDWLRLLCLMSSSHHTLSRYDQCPDQVVPCGDSQDRLYCTAYALRSQFEDLEVLRVALNVRALTTASVLLFVSLSFVARSCRPKL